MQLPFMEQAPPFEVLPSQRLTQFYDDPQPPLSFIRGCFSPLGLHLQLQTYEKPTNDSYFCFTVLCGKKLLFSKNFFPGNGDSSLPSHPIAGENLVGQYWGVDLLIPTSLWQQPLSISLGLCHGDRPLCFLKENDTSSKYPLVSLNPMPHQVSSLSEIPEANHLPPDIYSLQRPLE